MAGSLSTNGAQDNSPRHRLGFTSEARLRPSKPCPGVSVLPAFPYRFPVPRYGKLKILAGSMIARNGAPSGDFFGLAPIPNPDRFEPGIERGGVSEGIAPLHRRCLAGG